MTKYKVSVGESILHTIDVEADSEDVAIAKAKELIGEVDDVELKRDYAYTVDSVDWDGWEEAEVIP